MPSVARAVLDYAIAWFEENFGSVIQFENHFAGDDYVEVHGVGGVHAGMVAFQNIEHAGELLLDFFDGRSGVKALDARRGVRRNGEETKTETLNGGEIARRHRQVAVRGELGAESLPQRRWNS